MGYYFLVLLNVLVTHPLTKDCKSKSSVGGTPSAQFPSWEALVKDWARLPGFCPPGTIVVTVHRTLGQRFKGLSLSSKQFLFGCN